MATDTDPGICMKRKAIKLNLSLNPLLLNSIFTTIIPLLLRPQYTILFSHHTRLLLRLHMFIHRQMVISLRTANTSTMSGTGRRATVKAWSLLTPLPPVATRAAPMQAVRSPAPL